MKLYRAFGFFFHFNRDNFISVKDSGNEIIKLCHGHFVNGLSYRQDFIAN